MDKITIDTNYGELFVLEKNKIYKFPDFTLEYISDYQDSIPDSFPNKESGLFRGRLLFLKSDHEEKEFKDSEGSGIIINKHFNLNNKDYSIIYTNDKDRGSLISIVEGKAPSI